MRNKKRQASNGGFTLVELVVSFVIMLMLVTLSVAGVLVYQDYADYKRQNSYAQTLFSAAQTKLVDYSVRGQLKQLEESASDVVDLSLIVTPDGTPASESESTEAVKDGMIYCLIGDRDSYEKYRAGEYEGRSDQESRAYQALYGIFDEFLFDKSILNACIALEFDPDSGQVYSVLYSDKCRKFTYIETSRNGRVNISDRQDGYRNEYMIGYYGLD